MKRKVMKAVALLMALALLTGLALAEQPLEGLGLELDSEALDTGAEALPEAEAVEETAVELGDVALIVEETDPASEATYRFVVDGLEYASQTARAGEEIALPADPEAPAGMAFAGWTLVDGTPVFVDGDGDGEIDPVIVGKHELGTEVYVWAEFAETEPAEEPVVEEALADEESLVAEEPVAEEEALVEEEAPVDEEPAKDEDADLQKPSPMGKVDQPEAGTDEVPGDMPGASEITETEPESIDEVDIEAGPAAEETSSVTADAATQGASQPDLAENSPLESFPGAAVSPKGEALETEEPSVEAAPALPTANALTYTGEAQALVSGEGWLYSLDGESYGPEIPTAVDAGEYAVYFKAAGDAEAQALTVVIAKADVVFIAPVAAATGDA